MASTVLGHTITRRAREPHAAAVDAVAPLRSAVSSLFLLFATAYYSSYPIRVYARDAELEVFRPGLLIAACLFALQIAPKLRALLQVRLARADALAGALLLAILAAYGLNTWVLPDDELLKHSFYKHAAFTAPLLLFLCLRRNLRFRIPSTRSTWLLTFLAFNTACASVLNAVLQRLPTACEVLDDKYQVGPFLRAGGGYLDPNFLSLNIASLLALVLLLQDKKSTLARANVCALLLSLFLTFSRGAYVFLGVTLLLMFLKGGRRERHLAVVAGAVAVVVAVPLLFHAEFLFRRFTDAEGASSTSDRLAQYAFALRYIWVQGSLRNLLFGFGGLNFAYQEQGVHLHNYLLALLFEAGLLPVLLLSGLFVYFYRASETLEARLYLAFAGMQLMVLPNAPDALYMGFCMSLISVTCARSDVRVVTRRSGRSGSRLYDGEGVACRP